MTSKSLFSHSVLAILLSYALSVFFWVGLGVFNLTGFFVVSTIAAAIGLLAGWALGKRLVMTALVTIIARIGLYYFMMRG